uniref:hypothetical protein n=1 Tax=Pedobacter schmidteae TaxID=2201271 RepID=UPI000EABFBDF|nr:hypothetical protein [Pedobacter schmidteae]
MRFEEEEVERSTILKVDVEGNDSAIWEKCKASLMEIVTKILEAQIHKDGKTTADEIKRASSNLLDFANAKLERPTIENQKLLTEIDLMLANESKTRAETRKIDAEAEAIELGNLEKRFRIAIGAATVLAGLEKNQEGLLFCKDLESLIAGFSSKQLFDNKEIQ